MIVIQNINSQKFSLNGIPYFKNFMPHSIAGKLRIVNVYETKFQLTDFENFSDYSVNGIEYANVVLLQDALLIVLYTRNTLNGSGATPYSQDFTYTSGPQDFTIATGVTVKHVFRGRLRLYEGEFTVAGTLVTIIYDTLEAGEKISITN